ncbi:XRE family transcriptional regulator [Pseudoalteromonas sp. JC28]|uniref:helix-turn-helix domain-containing protein n=1 Tax=Pseudoalteromonas sp. JC28 TaxID=2267617 RepID=UPI001572E939|nr:helix-turn-helix transcriptional regulator [Pseudoalteromonas sp. JC28]NSY32282.1 XRE family transcriptional regulator [Pseudoalteromonas sp. JC28]
MNSYWVATAKKRMKDLGLKQCDLLDVFGVTTRGAVGHYFSGRQPINVDQLEALSKKLGIRIDYYDTNDERYSIDEINTLLSYWIPKLSKTGLARYETTPDIIKNLIISSLSDKQK